VLINCFCYTNFVIHILMQALFAEILGKGVLKLVRRDVADLYKDLETTFQPLQVCRPQQLVFRPIKYMSLRICRSSASAKQP
jgi:hypothetical protein